jgi:hypothetical protein
VAHPEGCVVAHTHRSTIIARLHSKTAIERKILLLLTIHVLNTSVLTLTRQYMHIIHVFVLFVTKHILNASVTSSTNGGKGCI